MGILCRYITRGSSWILANNYHGTRSARAKVTEMADQTKQESVVKSEKPLDEAIITEKKNDELLTENVGTTYKLFKDPSNFEVKRILKNVTARKLICIEGKFRDKPEQALVILEKKIFPDDQVILQDGFFNEKSISKELYQNDVYSSYDFFPPIENNGLNATIIYPATEKHVERFVAPELFLIEETPDIYENVTLPKIIEESLSVEWIDNVLDGSCEADRVIFDDKNEDNGFVIVKDLKWDGELATLYVLAITRKKIRSIRDLNASHLPLLKNIEEAGSRAIFEKYGVPKNQLRIYFHYQPSYYHLHVHFSAFTNENSGSNVERAHLLRTVINNIEMMPDYYQKAVLSFQVPKRSQFELYENYNEQKKKNGIVVM